jgi:DNA-binding transcriptional LysR family regulator
MSFDLHRSRTFVSVVRHGSISAAADALGFTQSAVSQQLSTLERDVGLSLVDRGRRPLRPTRAGADLLPAVGSLLGQAATLDSAVADMLGLRRGRVDLVAFASALASLLPPVVGAFRAAHPGIEVGVAEAETDAALAALRAGAADVALVHLMPGQAIDDAGGLVRVALGDDPLHAVLPAGHPLAARSTIALGDLAAEPLVVPRGDGRAGPFRRLVEALVAETGAELRVAYEVDDLQAAQAFAAAGLGAVLMHGLAVGAGAPGVAVRPLTTARGARRVEAIRVAGRRVPAARPLWDALARAEVSRPSPGEPARSRRPG